MTATTADQYARAQAKADELRTRAEQEQAAQQQATADRALAHDRQVVADFPAHDRELQQQEAQALEDFRAAVLADPVFEAWARYRAGRWKRTHLRGVVQTAMDSTGSTDPRPADLRYYEPRLVEDVVALLEDHARDLAADTAQEWDDARQAAVTPGA